MQTIIDGPRSGLRQSTGWARVRRPLLSSCAAAAMLIAAGHTRPARAQAFQATGTVQSGAAVITTGTNTTNIAIGGAGNSQVVINWVPNNTALAGTGSIAFMPTSVANPTTATFTGAPGVTNFTVLNNVIPTLAADQMRAIAIDGTIQSTITPTVGVPAVRGGNVWFYSPGGIIAGGTAIFNVGGLLLTSSAIDTTGGLYGNGATSGQAGGSIRLASPTDSTRAVIVQPGAQVNANVAQNSYVALVAPRVTQGGTVNVRGSAAYVAAESANLNFSTDGGLVAVSVVIGSHTDGTAADGVTLTHTGTTGGPASTGASDARDIFFVNLPKNNAVTMLLSGNVGYQPAVSASIENGAIVLGAGSSVNNAFAVPQSSYNGVPSASFNANIDLAGGTFTSDVTAFYTGNGNVTSRLGDLQFTQDLKLLPSQGSGAIGNSTVAAINGNDIGVGGALSIYSAPGHVSQASADGGSTFTVGGATLISSDQYGNSESGYGTVPATAGNAGTALLTANGGDIVLAGLTLSANGLGGTGSNFAGGAGVGGTATIRSQSGGTIQVSGPALVSATGTGGAGTPATGGAGTGGSASIISDDGQITFTGSSLNVTAAGVGGAGGTGGAGQGGSAGLSVDNELVAINSTSSTGISASGTGGVGTATGGTGTGGALGLDFANGTFNAYNALTLTDTGTGGSGPAAGAGTGGQLSITGTSSVLSFTSLTADAGGRGGSNSGSVGAVAGGAGTGGSVTMDITNEFGEPLLTATTLTLAADGVGSGPGCGANCVNAYGPGAAGLGGDVSLSLGIGTVSIGSVTLSATGTGGGGSRSSLFPNTSGDGGEGTGGTADFARPGFGDLTLGTVTVDASGLGGAGGAVVQGVSAPSIVPGGNGGQGLGGDATFASSYGGQITGTLSVLANGTGGAGGVGVSGAGGLGGVGQGGNVTLTMTQFNPFSINALIATGNGVGGAGGASTGGAGGTGANGAGGIVLMDNAGSFLDVSIDDTATITANGTGGAGGASDAGTGGAGGDGGGSSATVRTSQIGTITFNGTTRIAADGNGGAGGASIAGNGGAGGNGTGSNALVEAGSIFLNTLSFNGQATVSVAGVGGAGGATQTGQYGGAGGAGTGGGRQSGGAFAMAENNGRIEVGADDQLTVDISARGGAGGNGGSISGGAGGNATAGRGGVATAQAAGAYDAFQTTIAGTAIGGDGGTGQSFTETGYGAIPPGTRRDGGSGGVGGDALGGQASLYAGGDTFFTGDLSIDVSGTGGVGGDGGTGAGYAGTPGTGGAGGFGGQGDGGTIDITAGGAAATLPNPMLIANGQGGDGGVGAIGGTTPAVPPMGMNPGTPAIPGQQAQAGDGGTGHGGSVSILVVDGTTSTNPPVPLPGSLNLGATTISTSGNGGFYGGTPFVGSSQAGRVVIRDNASAPDSLVISQLDVSDTGAFATDQDSVNLIADDGPIAVSNSAYVNSEYAFVSATGASGLDVGGELSLTGYNGVTITHGDPGRDTIHAGSFYAFTYGNFLADTGTVVRSDNGIDITAYNGINAAELRAYNYVYGRTYSNDADIDIGIATADAPVDTGYGFNGQPPTFSAVALYAGNSSPAGDASIRIRDEVSATGRVVLRAGSDVVVDAGATVTSDNSVQIDAGNNVRISGTVTAAADPLSDPSTNADPETSYTSSLDISAGTIDTLDPNRTGLILVDGTIAAPGRAVRLDGTAIQVDNAIDARSLIAGIHDAPPLGSTPDNQGGLLRTGCEVGNICLGSLLTTRIVEIGGAAGTTDALPNRVTLTGGFGGFTSSVRANGDIILGNASSTTVYSGTSLLRIESVHGSDTFLGLTTLRSGSGYSYSYHGNIDILAAGDISGPGTAIDSDQDVAFHAGGNLSLASLIFGSHLNTLDSSGATTATDDLIVPGAVSINDSLSAGDNVRIDAGTSLAIGQVTASNGAAFLQAGTTATLGDVFGRTTLDIVAPDGISAGQVSAGDRVQLISARGPISATHLFALGPNAATDFTGNAFISANGAVSLGQIDVYSFVGLTSQTSNVSINGDISASNVAILAGNNVSAGNVDTNLFYVGSPDAAQTVYGSGYAFGQTAALTPDVAALSAGGVTRVGGDVNVTGNLSAGRIMIGAGRDISLTRDEGITRGPNGITDALTLDAGRDINATGNFTATQAAVSAGRDIRLANLRLFDSGSLDAGGDIDAEQLDIGGSLSAAGANVTLSAVTPLHVTSATASGGTLTISGGDIQLDGATAHDAIDVRADDVASFAGDIAAPAIDIASSDIVIDPAARIGIDTNIITLTSLSGSRAYVGGDGSANGWALSNAEFGRLSAHTITINAQPAEDVYALEIGQLDVIGSAGADAGGRRQNLTGSDLVFNAIGSTLVSGALSLTNAGTDDTLSINATDRIDVLTPGGSIALSGPNGALGGRLNLAADTIFVGSQQALTDLAGLTSVASRNTRLDTNDGAVSAAGYLQAGGLTLTGGDAIYIQNSGTRDTPDTRAGFTVGAGGVAVVTAGDPTEVIINGRQASPTAPGGFVTGAALLNLITVTGGVNPTGNSLPATLARGSTLNSCLFDGTPCSVKVPVPVPVPNIPPVQDVINTSLDPTAQLAFLFQLPLIELGDVVSVGLEPLIDDPVTGAGNEDLWLGGGDADDERDRDKARGTAG